MESFGSRLKLSRNKKNVTQSELGKMLNVTYVAISKWETNDRFPDKDTLIKLGDIFDVTTDWLLCRTDDKDSKVYESNGFTIGINKNYPHDLSPEEVELLLVKLKEVGFDVNKLIRNVKEDK